MTNDERKARYELAKENLRLEVGFFLFGIKTQYYRIFPHTHQMMDTRLMCRKCFRPLEDLLP